MRRQIPLIIVFISGFTMMLDYFFPSLPVVHGTRELFLNWSRVAFSFAMLLGVFTLLLSNLKKIALQQSGWIFNAVLILSFAVTFFFAAQYKMTPSGSTWITIKGTQVGQTGYQIFQTVYTPLSSSIFALVAFFIASAAFRAFRAKNIEAVLLLSAAIVVMLGSIPFGDLLFNAFLSKISSIPFGFSLYNALHLSQIFGEHPVSWLSNQIQQIPMLAAQRAINFGAAIGMVFMSIKILTGIDRSYFGGGES